MRREGGAELTAARGEKIAFRVVWPECAAPCGGAESYVSFDPGARAIVSSEKRALVIR